VPTPSENKALIFLTGVILVGGAVRMTNAVRGAEHADAASRDALRRQIVAVESAGAVERRGKRAGPKQGKGRASSARKGTAPGQESSRTRSPAERAWRADGDLGIGIVVAPPKPVPKRQTGGSTASAGPPPAPLILDVDRATAAELERLPRIGPALAARIVQDRSERGDYGSIQGLQRVRGVGPAMAAALAPYVTFSGTPRPSIAGGAVSGASIEGGRKRPRPAPP
jgi:competence protein ComEA